MENVPVNPPSEMVPPLTESAVLDARFRVSVAESGPLNDGGKVPVTFEKIKYIWLDAVSVTPEPVSTK